ncbi:MAG: hypothetical protein Q7T34_02905 [Candidatus Parcubacteria bacterium]|nr:hypothetical protein [Candidatus Parcubacteria bacterium]
MGSWNKALQYIQKEVDEIQLINGTTPIERGLLAEEKAVFALNSLKDRGNQFPGKRRIVDVRRTERGSEEDYQGKDIVIVFQTGETIYVQVKNWWTKNAEKKYIKRGICFIAVFSENNGKGLEKIIYNTISRFLRKNNFNKRKPYI